MYCIEILYVYVLSFQNQNIYLDQEIEQIQSFLCFTHFQNIADDWLNAYQQHSDSEGRQETLL